MAEINISNLGGGGGGTLALTTTGTGGASTYVAGVLNIPVYQSQLTNPVTGTGTATRVAFWNTASSVSSSANLYWDDSNSFLGVGTATPGARLQVNGTGLLTSTAFAVKDSGGTDSFTVRDNGNTSVRGVLTITGSSASNSATLMGRTSTGEVASVALGTNLSFSGNTLNATGGGTPAGSTGEIQFNNSGNFGASSNLFWDNAALPGGQRLGIGTSTPASSVHIVGAGATSGTTSFLVQNNSPSDLLRVDNSGVLTIGASSSLSSIGASRILSSSSLANSNIVVSPKGTGSFILGPPPDGTIVGGNARGDNAIDLQLVRAAATQVASGTGSVAIGRNMTSSGTGSVAIGNACISTASGAVSIGNVCTSSGIYSFSTGTNTLSNLYGQKSFGSGDFSTAGDAQSIMLVFRRSITGTGIAELFLDGASSTATLSTSRAWNVQITLVATVQTAGTGTLVVGDTYIGTYQVGVKNIGGTASLIGAVQNVITAQSDTNMSTSVVTIDATGAKLRIQFTPPTGGTSSATSVIRVVATAFGTQIGF